MLHDRLFVFDIETVPDTEAVANLTGFVSDEPAELRAELERYHLDITEGRNGFPRQPFHKVVAISFLEAAIGRSGKLEEYTFQRLASGQSDTEEGLVRGFFDYFSRAKPRLVSYNGRNFDLPVLKFRAMKYGVTAPFLYGSGDKWNSYTSRYSADWHCDLLNVLKDYGAMGGGLKLNEVCAILGFPGKFGVDGSKVAAMFEAGELQAIRDYCETDVLNTFLVYLRYQQHTGVLATESYNRAIGDLLEYLQKRGAEEPCFSEFHKAWEEAAAGRFYLGDEQESAA